MLTLAASYWGRGYMHRPRMWDYGGGNFSYWGYGGAFPFFLFSGLLGLIILIAVVFLVVKLFQYKKAAEQATGSKALAILEERYAKGEIGEDEFKKMKKNILS